MIIPSVPLFCSPKKERLIKETLGEIIRLAPTGEGVPAQVILVGPISENVENELKKHGFSTLRLGSENVFQTAAEVAKFRLVTIPPEGELGKQHLIVASADDGEEALPALYYTAHTRIPIIFVYRNSVPKETRRILRRFSDRNITLFGSEKSISTSVEKEIKSIVEDVDHLEANTPYDLSVKFAVRSSSESQIGWSRKKRGGHAFSFGTTSSWRKVVAGSLLGHIGKHTPLLLVRRSKVPKIVDKYLLKLNPVLREPPRPPFMHGFILGDFDDISDLTQVKLEERLIKEAGN
ncbi:cell wall-binding repeat-containing protein [Halobacillus shinanisalinarum]|uniref:Cell wall-binding repeat-containing protein n=1 Tax=Halobacillus shinanisalinarum TaxID=2932258 RepID=A0ABY4H0K7_9BACI|nr:cell wall-binding repeat-containing protein [Halobacillus shinanisalinarum]UOQ93985.1 cell wall-binding repeat-containing protein [Halobacillus shinanisalinarum]